MPRLVAAILAVVLSFLFLTRSVMSGQAELEKCLGVERNEFRTTVYGWKPPSGPAERAVAACTAFIAGGGEPGQLASAYVIRARGYAGLGQDAKAVADMKKAHELSPSGETRCGLANLRVPGHACAGGGGGGPLGDIY